uniref:PHD-type domain-containing protein n=1 Tax=Caenorhabditis tropicalis TaxID=1561998 RepID=A0A1I7T3W0_9PELO
MSDEPPAIWVPTETGLEPEEYAEKIMDHYPDEKKAAQLALLAQQQAAGTVGKQKRKRSSKGETSSKERRPPPKALPLLMPPALSSIASRPSTSSVTSGPLTPANGHLSVPPGKTTIKRDRVALPRAPIPQNRSRTVYPVKKLTPMLPATSTPSSIGPHGMNPVSMMTNPRMPVPSPVTSRMINQKTPFPDYPASMRSKQIHQQQTLSQILPLAPQNQNRNAPSATPAAKTIANGTPKVLPRTQPRPSPSAALLKQQPRRPVLEQQALAHQRLRASIHCQRVTPINVQFAIHAQYRKEQRHAKGNDSGVYEQREWPPKAKPVQSMAPSMPHGPPSVQRTMSNTSSSGTVPQRPRSFSITTHQQQLAEPKRIPPIAAPTVAPSTPVIASNAIQRTVGVAKSRPEMLSLQNNRAKMTPLRETAPRKAEKIIIPSLSPSMKSAPQGYIHPGAVPSKSSVAGLAAVAAAMAADPANVDSNQSLVSVKLLTAKIRKENGKMTPEQIAVAIRNETQRIMKGEGDGEKEAIEKPIPVQSLS